MAKNLKLKKDPETEEKVIPVSLTQRQMLAQASQAIQNAQAGMNALCTTILAGHDITQGNIVRLADEGLIVQVPKVA